MSSYSMHENAVRDIVYVQLYSGIQHANKSYTRVHTVKVFIQLTDSLRIS